MAILFMGGEEIDFPITSGTPVLSTSNRRTSYSRVSLRLDGGADYSHVARSPFTQASSNFWFTFQFLIDRTSTASRSFVTFYDGNVKRLVISMNVNWSLTLTKFNDAGVGTAVVTTPVFPNTVVNNLRKYDFQINYGTSGGFRVFQDQVEVINFSGDLIGGSSTSLNGFALSGASDFTNGWSFFSEIIAIERDTRTLSLKTHTPTSTGATNAWSGSHVDIDEVTPNTADVAFTDVNEAVASFGCDDLPAGNMAVRGFKVSAYAARGADGPQNLQLGVTTGGTNSFGSTKSVDAGWSKLNQYFEVNPVTGLGWTQADINGIEIAAKAKP